MYTIALRMRLYADQLLRYCILLYTKKKWGLQYFGTSRTYIERRVNGESKEETEPEIKQTAI